MQWFRNLFGKQAARPAPVRPSIRPQLEALEERQLLNASTVWDSAGNKTQFIVFAPAAGSVNAGGVAFRIDSKGATQIGTGVRLVHGYKDQNGNVGFDIVYANGYAAEFDSTGARQIGNGSNVLDASHAFDANGNFKFDVVYIDGKGQGTGNLFEYTNKGGSLTGTNIYFATAFVDAAGVLSNAYGILDTNSPALGGAALGRAFVVDSAGTRLLAIGFFNNIGEETGIQDYDQVTDPNGKAVVDLTTDSFGRTVFAPTSNIVGATVEVSSAGTTSFGTNLEPF